ncbi:helix-turn-helix transcriptional regulator [Methylophaga nitratireducenticrescens]|uniref:helix-turn-helix transcriptional regulator n=1 Tax=Methylophaga nitratireducenticrescens TaxID=754476 RepID=UPI000CDCB0BA|nr:AraC family transcriptional regulator [Methylophaga nitratireducenticrescens]AUZ84571.1 AraC family transcriptional regulator [Methylophaga nitratireducenticrescens]
MNWQEQIIHFSDLQRLNTCYSIFSKEFIQDDVLLKGLFHHSFNRHGLSIQAGNLIEMRDRTSFAELPPGISFTIMFQGAVSFSLGPNCYQLGKYRHADVDCSAFILNQPEILSRHFKRGMRVCKLNIFIERYWLEEKARTTKDKDLLDQMFSKHCAFHYWLPSKQIIDRSKALLDLCDNSSIRHQLLRESFALQIVGECLEELSLCSGINGSENTADMAPMSLSDSRLIQRIDALLLRRMAIPEMAETLGLSMSTLQRRFKSAYGMTVNKYSCQKRLEMAKKALIVEKKSIGEAAFIAGYAHPSNFISAFKKRFSFTPSEFVQMSSQRAEYNDRNHAHKS